VDQSAKDDKHEAKEAKTVTLEVTLEGAQKLALATQMGDISLSLRRLGEKDDPNAPPPPLVTDVNTIDAIKKINADMGSAKAGGPKSASVRLYSGSTVQNIPVRQTLPDK
jgi:pilus assembly protein CpaB